MMVATMEAGAQLDSIAWHGKKCAVVLTYDDAVPEQLDNALPALDSLGLKASFYITAFNAGCKERITEWKKAAANGHELGNHTLFHPCLGNSKGREWVSPETDMSRYTVKRMENEIRMTNVFLQALDGSKQRTFAFTCGDTKIGDSAFINGLKNDFIAARSVRGEMHTIDQVDLYDIDCFVVNGETGTQMIQWVKKAVANNALLVILFHGVGGGHPIDVSSNAHSTLLHYLKQNEKDIWVAPLVEVATHIKQYRLKK